MIDLDRIALEAIPDGTFGGSIPPTPRRTDPETAREHLAALADAISRGRRTAYPAPRKDAA